MSKSNIAAFVAAFIAALSLISTAYANPGSPTAAAQKTSDVDTVTISPNLQITLPEKTFRMWPEQFYEFKGGYQLSNGMTLVLFNIGHGMYAKMSGQESHRIVPTATNTFVAVDRQLKMTIDLKENGEASGEVLFVVPALVQANGNVIGEHFVASTFR
ncbi:MAG: hypothetical protein V4447_08800 [Pseudomonadota bacterium]